jgi:flagellar hook-associated protein 3 FlgL
MRLSNNLMYQNSINNILKNQQGVASAQERVTTGEKYLTTSEAPAAVSQGMLYTNKIETNEQYTKNINQLKGRLETEHSILKGMNENILATQELTIRAGNGSLSKSDLAGIAGELQELQKSLVNLMNTQSEGGKYIFSGYQDNIQTYTFNNLTKKYEYQGDQGQHEVTIAKGVEIKSSDNGFNAFEKVNARLDVTSNRGIATGTITSGTVYVSNQGEFDKFHSNNYNTDPDPLVSATVNTYNVNVLPGATASSPDTYEILRDGVPLVPPVTGEVTDEAIEFAGMEIKLEGEAPGQLDFSLEKPHKENVLNTLQGLITSLKDETLEGEDLQQALASGLIQLKNASEQVVFTQSSLGGRMNVVDKVTDSNSAVDINNKASKSSLVEVDMAEAISELTKQETGLQASQATFGRLAKLTLFDYI